MTNVKGLIVEGKVLRQEKVDIEQIVDQLKKKRKWLHDQKVDDLLDFLDALSNYWRKNTLSKRLYSKNILDFLEKKNLRKNLQFSLRGNIKVLDEFVRYEDFDYSLHAQPRGLSVHWLAGNVSILGLFSIFSSIITKNVCLIKASSRGFEEIVSLLESIKEVNTEKIKGCDILECISVVLIERENLDASAYISKNADIRIAWGGREAIDAINRLEKGPYTEDIIFGPKYSYIIIDEESLDANFKKIAQRVAIDVSVFDQYACSSPHTVIVESIDEEKVVKFAEELSRQMDLVNRTLIPKELVDSGKSMEIMNLRSRYLFKGKVFASKGTEWTVIYSKEDGLFKGCFSRVVMVKSIKSLKEVGALNDRQKQTLGVALTGKSKEKYLDEITLLGIDRCPDVGQMTYYEVPWDGMFIFDRMVRWVSVR